jgi:mannose-6-phosphate isomerase-like protein (cupin superfamily)
MPETPNPSAADRTGHPSQTLIIPPDGGDTIHAYGDTAQVMLSGKQTNGSMVVAVGTSPPGGGPPPHRHRNEDEMFIVLEGKIRFLVNGQWTEPLAPAVSFTPRAVWFTPLKTPGRRPVVNGSLQCQAALSVSSPRARRSLRRPQRGNRRICRASWPSATSSGSSSYRRCLRKCQCQCQ